MLLDVGKLKSELIQLGISKEYPILIQSEKLKSLGEIKDEDFTTALILLNADKELKNIKVEKILFVLIQSITFSTSDKTNVISTFGDFFYVQNFGIHPTYFNLSFVTVIDDDLEKDLLLIRGNKFLKEKQNNKLLCLKHHNNFHLLLPLNYSKSNSVGSDNLYMYAIQGVVLHENKVNNAINFQSAKEVK